MQAKKTWRELSPAQRGAVVAVGCVQLGLAAAAWRDLARRPAGEIRGVKALWVAVIAVNFVGPIAYFRWGRKPGKATSAQ